LSRFLRDLREAPELLLILSLVAFMVATMASAIVYAMATGIANGRGDMGHCASLCGGQGVKIFSYEPIVSNTTTNLDRATVTVNDLRPHCECRP